MIEDDYANLLAALERAYSRAAPVLTLQLLEPLVRYWSVRGLLHEGRSWLERTLLPLARRATQGDASAGMDDPAARHQLAWVCLMTADLLFLQSDYTASQPYLQASVACWRALDQADELAVALLTQAGAFGLAGETGAAGDLLAEAEALALAGGAETRASLALSYGRTARHRGQPRAARGWLAEAVAYYHARGDLWQLAGVLLDLTPVLLMLGEEREAEAHAAEALALARQLKSAPLTAIALNDLGEVARYGGRDAEAAAHYAESLRLLRHMGSPAEEPRLRHNLAQLALRRGDLAAATAGFVQSLGQFAERQLARGVMEGVVGLAAVATALGEPLVAARLWGTAAALAATESWELWPADQLVYAQAVAQARVVSEPAAFDAAWQAGRALPLDELHTLIEDVRRRAIAAA